MVNTIARHIVTTPNICFGKPRIAGHRITVADVAIMHLRMGLSLEEIAGKYKLDPAAVYAAMAYYLDHREEIEKRIAKDAAFVAALQRRSRSPRRTRIQTVKNG
ncbi:MAG: DUF433 domain-containing protein [Planctomycetota bacterium]|nr:DUF433 domain-containing protein [Planctomycetota bacterium]